MGKKEFYTSYFEKNKNKSSEIWKGIRSLVNIKSSKTSNIRLLDQQENLINDPNKISNIFNDHFSTIGKKIERKIPFTPGNFYDYLNKRIKMVYPTSTLQIHSFLHLLFRMN